jgi:RNA polymerase sigma-70 factor (ECF subfamily)
LETLEQAAGRVARGDSAAFQIIVSATSDRLVRLAARLLGNVSDAEDVVQEAYVKAYRALMEGQFDGRSSVATWLYSITTRGAIDALRSRKSRPLLDDESHPEPGFDGQGQAEARLAVLELGQLLEGLPAEQRAALVLKSVEGLTTPEIARILDCSEGAVEQRLVRARATLRERSAS